MAASGVNLRYRHFANQSITTAGTWSVNRRPVHEDLKQGHLRGEQARLGLQIMPPLEYEPIMPTLSGEMKALGRTGIVMLLFGLLSSCASRTEVMTESETTSAAPVPGEKIPGDVGLAPGGAPGSANASVRW